MLRWPRLQTSGSAPARVALCGARVEDSTGGGREVVLVPADRVPVELRGAGTCSREVRGFGMPDTLVEAEQILARLEKGEGTADDIEKLLDIADGIFGKSFCALGDGAASPITSSIKYFRDEYVAHFEHGGCPFDPHRSTLFAGVMA